MAIAGFVKKWAAPLVLVVLLAVWALVFHARPGARPVSGPLNILMISACSVRADHMSCYGYRRQTTPNFESLAGESFVFERAITQWPKTAPGFAAILTGKYGHTNGVMRITPGGASRGRA